MEAQQNASVDKSDLTQQMSKLSVAMDPVTTSNLTPLATNIEAPMTVLSDVSSNGSTVVAQVPLTASPTTTTTMVPLSASSSNSSTPQESHGTTDVTNLPSVSAARPRPAPPVPRKDGPISPKPTGVGMAPTRPMGSSPGVLRKKKPGGPSLKIEPPKSKRSDTSSSFNSGGLLTGASQNSMDGSNDDYNPPDSATERGDGSSLLPAAQPLNIPASTNKIDMNDSDLQEILELGSGNGGTVHKVRHKPTSQVMARKIIIVDAKPTQRKQITRELQILHDCNSPYIVGFYGAYLVQGDVAVVMEYMDCGSLEHLLKKAGKMPEPYIAKVTYAVLQGLEYLYKQFHIIHRDVKPSNILINSKGEVKIADFGVSGQLVNSMANTFVGTSSYMSPERIEGKRYQIQSDVWSLGMTLMELALGRHPFSSGTDGGPLPIIELLGLIVKAEAPTLPAGEFTPAFEDFIAKCLIKDPETRPTPKQLLQHPFVSNVTDGNILEWLEKIGLDKLKFDSNEQ